MTNIDQTVWEPQREDAIHELYRISSKSIPLKQLHDTLVSVNYFVTVTCSQGSKQKYNKSTGVTFVFKNRRYRKFSEK